MSTREIRNLTKQEIEGAVPDSASWHQDYKHTAYIFIGGLPYELSEGDIVAIFSQYGEPIHLNLMRDKETGKSKGYAFLKYEDQRSTNLAVDNLTGIQVLGRTIRVDHTEYKQKEGDGAEEAFAGLNLLPKEIAEADGVDEDRKDRKRRRKGIDGSPEDATERRERKREDMELQKLEIKHDEDDPMKDYLVRTKKEEIAEARATRAKLHPAPKIHKHRYHHRRRGGSEERSNTRSHSKEVRHKFAHGSQDSLRRSKTPDDDGISHKQYKEKDDHLRSYRSESRKDYSDFDMDTDRGRRRPRLDDDKDYRDRGRRSDTDRSLDHGRRRWAADNSDDRPRRR